MSASATQGGHNKDVTFICYQVKRQTLYCKFLTDKLEITK